MSDEHHQNKGKFSRMQHYPTKRVRVSKVKELVMTGKSIKQIASNLGVHRTTVSRILQSDEVKQILKQEESRLNEAMPKATDTFIDALEQRSTDMTNAVKVAHTMLKSAGVIKDKVQHEHTFPKPTIIKRLDGSEVILGSKPVDEDGAA